MIDVRPVFNVIGVLVASLGVTMIVPFATDVYFDNGHWPIFLESAALTVLVGVALALATGNATGQGLSIQQTFLLTTSVWAALPLFGAVPFILGATQASFTDAYFEAMSGLTTTGSTVLSGLDALPEGIIVWRAILQWLGGVGIIVVAMVFLPELRVGGMQIFRSEGFDTFGKILPRATEIAARVSWIYFGLTVLCTVVYIAAGMRTFDAVVHSMTTLSTGGFAAHDASFAVFPPGAQYAAVVFMCLAALPFVRFVQLLDGQTRPLFSDQQIQLFLVLIAALTAGVALWLQTTQSPGWEVALRQTLFNLTSIVTGTGYASTDYGQWGAVALVVVFFAGLIGGCAGSTSCSVKVFRYQLLYVAAKQQVRQIFSPSGIFPMRYAGRSVAPDVMNSVLSFFVIFIASVGGLTVALSLTGLDLITSLSGATAALANIGPGLGPEIGPAGNFGGLNDPAKWLLSFGMLLGRLEILAVFTLFTVAFWRS
ncbi:MAG: TrkH family potassium uptake protein [Pseudomonadota bacterium]